MDQCLNVAAFHLLPLLNDRKTRIDPGHSTNPAPVCLRARVPNADFLGTPSHPNDTPCRIQTTLNQLLFASGYAPPFPIPKKAGSASWYPNRNSMDSECALRFPDLRHNLNEIKNYS